MQKQGVLLTASALLGVSVVSIVTFTSIATLTRRLVFATICFSIAIPALAASIYQISDRLSPSVAVGSSYVYMYLAGIFSAILGIAALFFHLNIWAGVVFALSSVTALAISIISIKE
jgi:hypothetical protein